MNPTEAQQLTSLRSLCHTHAKNASGSSYIFEQRAKRLKNLTRALKWLSLVLPSLVGYIVLNFGNITQPENKDYLSALINFAGAVGLVQFLVSLWGIADNWDDKLAYFAEAQVANRDLREAFESQAKKPATQLAEFEADFRVLDERRKQRDQQDSKYSPSEKECRKGMRYALRLSHASCIKCKEVPVTMQASDCPVCGQF